MTAIKRNYKTGTFNNLSFGCSHSMTNNINLSDTTLTAEEKIYLNQLNKLVGHGPTFLQVMSNLLNAISPWQQKDIFWNCHDRPANWTAFKAECALRNTSIKKLVTDELNKRGIRIVVDNKNGITFSDVPIAQLAMAANNAIQNNSGITQAFTEMALSYNFGNMDDDIKTFMQNPANAENIRGAVKDLNYVIPTSNDDIDILKFKQIYWGAYYLGKFPIPTGLLGVDCGQIGQTVTQLAAEKANLKQSDLDKLFTIYTESDLQQKMQAVSDMTTKFNGLYASNNCTVNQTSSGNDVLKYALYGIGGIFILVIAVKIMRHGKGRRPA